MDIKDLLQSALWSLEHTGFSERERIEAASSSIKKALGVLLKDTIGKSTSDEPGQQIERTIYPVVPPSFVPVSFDVASRSTGTSALPKIRTWEIWSEGYRATEQQGKATLHGKSKGISFEDACNIFASGDDHFARYFNPDTLTYWGCKLFPCEDDARRRFG